MCLIYGTTLTPTSRLFPLNDFAVREVHPDYQLSSSILHHRKEMVSRAI